MGARQDLRDATHRRVLDEAARLFRDRGFPETTIRDIADAAGVSLGTVMATGDKNGLLVQVFDDLIREHQDHPGREAGAHWPPDGAVARRTPDGAVAHWPPDGAAAHRPPDGAVVERLLDLVRPFVSLFAAQQDLARTYASILVSGRHRSILFSELSAALIDEFAAVASTGPAEPRATATALYYAYVGTLFTWAARPGGPDELLDSLGATFAAICGAGADAP